MHKANGFTLIEVATTLAVVAVCAAVGVPALHEFTQRQRITAAMQRVETQLASARLAAVTHGRRTTVCPLATPGACSEDGDWSRGSIAFFDADGNRKPDADGDLLHVDQVSAEGLRILTSSGRAYLRFLPDGRSPGRNLSLRFCDRELGLVGSLVVNNAGRTRRERPARPTACPL